MTTRNRAMRLDETLDSLGRIASPGVDWELLIADNGSRDDTRAVIDKYRSSLPVRYLYEPEPGMNRARNRALEAAQADFLVFTDDDVHVYESWLKELWQGALRWPEDNIFAGRIEPLLPANTPTWMASREFFFRGYAFAAYHLAEGEGPVSALPCGPNFAIRSSLLRENMFDPEIGPNGGVSYSMGAETKFLLWAKRVGNRFIYLPEAIVQHVIMEPQIRERHLLQRAFNAGRARELLSLDTEIEGRTKPVSTGKLRRDLARYRIKRLMHPFWEPERRFRNEVKLKIVEGRLHERSSIDLV